MDGKDLRSKKRAQTVPVRAPVPAPVPTPIPAPTPAPVRMPDADALQRMAAGIDPSAMQAVQNAMAQYQNHDEVNLLEELAAVAASERRLGNLDDEKLNGIVEMLSPMLSDSQQLLLKKLQSELLNEV